MTHEAGDARKLLQELAESCERLMQCVPEDTEFAEQRFADARRDVKAARAYLAQPVAQPSGDARKVVPREPDGYAYEYPGYHGKVIRFDGGSEYNGSKPLRAIPYWLGEPPDAAPAQAEPLPLDPDLRRLRLPAIDALTEMANDDPHEWTGVRSLAREVIRYADRVKQAPAQAEPREPYPVRLYALAHPDGTRLYLTVDEWEKDSLRYLDDVWKVVPLYAHPYFDPDCTFCLEALRSHEHAAPAAQDGRDLDALAPECIYLQVCNEDDCDEPFDAHYVITWCKDRINDRDVSYVRADISAAEIAALRARAEQAEADAERLDWIARQSLDELSFDLVRDREHDGEYAVSWVDVRGDRLTAYGRTLRAAIDRARTQEPKS